jgi:hypothetical protein
MDKIALAILAVVMAYLASEYRFIGFLFVSIIATAIFITKEIYE